MHPICSEVVVTIGTIAAVSRIRAGEAGKFSKIFEAFKYVGCRERRYHYLLNDDAVFAPCQCQTLRRMMSNGQILAIQTISRSYYSSEGPKCNRIRGNLQKKLNHAPIPPVECLKTINQNMALEV